MKDLFVNIIIFVLISTIVVGLITLIVWGIESLDIRSCERLSETSGYPTYYDSSCWIELRPDLVVRRHDIHRYLKNIDPEKQ
jgi:hypothetical protein